MNAVARGDQEQDKRDMNMWSDIREIWAQWWAGEHIICSAGSNPGLSPVGPHMFPLVYRLSAANKVAVAKEKKKHSGLQTHISTHLQPCPLKAEVQSLNTHLYKLLYFHL